MKASKLVWLLVFGGLCFLGLAPYCPAQDFSTASATNNRGQIVGGSFLNDQSAFVAFLLGRKNTENLGTFGGFAARADGINERGDAVGQADTPDLDVNGNVISLAFLFDGKQVNNLGTLPGFNHSQAFAINNSGVVVGWTYNLSPAGIDELGFQAFVSRKGTMLPIGDLGGGSSAAFGINDAGSIVGRARLPNGQFHAFLYSHGVMLDLGTLGGTRSDARAINNQGQAVGQATLANGARHAALFYGGAVIDLGTLGGNRSQAWSINDLGQIVGESTTATGETHAFLYADGQMHDLGTLGGTFSVARGINSHGDIVGESETATGDFHAFVIIDGLMIDIDSQLPQ